MRISAPQAIQALCEAERERFLSRLPDQTGVHYLRQLNWKPVDLGELERRVRRLDDLYTRCRDFFDRHSFGVVYAVRFAPGDLERMRYSSSMGIQAFEPIALTRIIGKAVLAVEDESRWPDRFGMMWGARALARSLVPRTDGLMVRLEAMESARPKGA
jgi:hypothetical protein